MLFVSDASAGVPLLDGVNIMGSIVELSAFSDTVIGCTLDDTVIEGLPGFNVGTFPSIVELGLVAPLLGMVVVPVPGVTLVETVGRIRILK